MNVAGSPTWIVTFPHYLWVLVTHGELLLTLLLGASAILHAIIIDVWIMLEVEFASSEIRLPVGHGQDTIMHRKS